MKGRGLSFYIPINNKKGYRKVRNFLRSNNLVAENGFIGLSDLNVSDYVYEMIVLLIEKKIAHSDEDSVAKLSSLINDIDNITNEIYFFETRQIPDGFGEYKFFVVSEKIEEKTKQIAFRCKELGIFNGD